MAAGWNKGKRHSEKTKQKIKEAMRRYWQEMDEGQRAKMYEMLLKKTLFVKNNKYGQRNLNHKYLK